MSNKYTKNIGAQKNVNLESYDSRINNTCSKINNIKFKYCTFEKN